VTCSDERSVLQRKIDGSSGSPGLRICQLSTISVTVASICEVILAVVRESMVGLA
jgi:hypothetical protein